jgi:hypothetical protein
MAEKLTKSSPRVLKTLRRFKAKKSLFDMTALGASFDLGLLRKNGEDRDGDPIWELTDAGRAALEKSEFRE